MKKNTVLFVLFILPIVAYLFFASGVNGYTKLPIIIPKITDLGNWKSLNNQKVSLNNKITVLGFSGYNVLKNRGNLYNLNLKIYQPYHNFKDLQFITLCPISTENDIKKIIKVMQTTTDMSHWHFVFASPHEIRAFYKQFNLLNSLDKDLGTPMVYIIDKERNLRGRKDKEKKEGYNTFHLSDLSNEMLDDFKIILYEYRAALKKNNNASKKL